LDVVPFRVAVRTWLLIGLQSFGGPAGQIALMQRILIDELNWLGQRRFLHALNFCMLLPGPEAQQLAIYIGWLLNGLRGGLVAGTLFVLPGVVVLLALSALYVGYGSTDFALVLLQGLAAAVIAVVVQAVIRVGRRALTSRWLGCIALAAFTALTLFALPFPIVIAMAGALGWAFGRRPVSKPSSAAVETGSAPLVSDSGEIGRPSTPRPFRVLATGACLEIAPVVAVALLFGRSSVFVDQGLFFSGAALVTFGGAYAVLAYVSHQAVSVYGWLTPAEMVRGLAFAESTPGPLIMVVQFVAFVGAYRNPGALNPWVAATLGGLLTTWVTFVPCFVFVLLGAPYVERLRANLDLVAALSGITAAVVGVIASLAVYFTVHTLFGSTAVLTAGPLHVQLPQVTSFQPVPAVLAVLAGVLLFRRGWSVLATLGVCAVASVGVSLAGGTLS
jgi:chromate transporter